MFDLFILGSVRTAARLGLGVFQQTPFCVCSCRNEDLNSYCRVTLIADVCKFDNYLLKSILQIAHCEIVNSIYKLANNSRFTIVLQTLLYQTSNHYRLS